MSRSYEEKRLLFFFFFFCLPQKKNKPTNAAACDALPSKLGPREGQRSDQTPEPGHEAKTLAAHSSENPDYKRSPSSPQTLNNSVVIFASYPPAACRDGKAGGGGDGEVGEIKTGFRAKRKKEDGSDSD